MADSVGWFGLSVVPVVIGLGIEGQIGAALRVVATASVVGGVLAFTTHGGRRITAAGLYCLALGVMTGSGAWYWASRLPSATTQEAILTVSTGIYTVTVFTYLVFWRGSMPPRPAPEDSPPPIPPRLARGAAVVGLAIFVLGASSELTVGTLARSTAEIGVIIFSAALALSGSIRVLGSPLRTIVIAGVLLTFYFVVFTGYGRLRLAALCLIILLVAQYRLTTRVKALTLTATVPVLLVFAAIGESRFAAKSSDPTAQASASGLGSLVNPLATFAQFASRDLELGHGSTFLAPVVALVPRDLWSDKPVQFGAVVVREMRPDMVGTNLAMPCLAQCEWYYNFSWLGMALTIPVLGYIVRWLDVRLARANTVPITAWHQLLVLVLLATLIGSVGDLAWGGTATWAVRNAQRVLVLAPLLAWAFLVHRHHARARRQGGPPVGPAHSPPESPRPRAGSVG